MYIAVSGNIGSGKTSLVELISNRYGYVPYYENIENPYLDDFYQNMSRWSFNLQICFLGNKAEQIIDIDSSQENVVQDRTLYEEGHIFVANLNRMGLMSSRDYDAYSRIFNIVASEAAAPDLVIYLKASVDTLIKQITKRGRAYEMNIERDYLESLNKLYDNWIENIYEGRKLIIDADSLDFISNPKDLEKIFEMVEHATQNIPAQK